MTSAVASPGRYAPTFMATKRPLLLSLCLGCLVLEPACGPPSEVPARGKTTKAEPGAAPEVEPNLRVQLGLDQRTFPLTVWAAYIIQTEYFDKTRIDPRAQLVSSLTYLGLHTPEFFAAVTGDQATVTVGAARKDFSLAGLADLSAAADRLEDILGFTQAELKLDTDATHKLEYAAINGLLAPLDPHTILLTPEEHTDLGVKTKGQFGGIGAEIREEERRIRIGRVLPGSPAEKGGLRAGDLVMQIDKQSTVNLRVVEAQQLLRGPVDTTVVVKVRRGEQTLTLTLTRQIIRVESVTSELLPGRIAYLKLSTFQENSGEQVRAALKNLAPKPADGEPEGLRGVVLDLRDNTGGLLAQAVEILDDMVASGELVIVRSAMGREFEAADPKLELPASAAVVALINEESASASEIVSGSIKYLGRGVVIGRPSFGKGTVQLVKPENLYGAELALKLTVAEYLVAGDRSIQTVGVQPDLTLFPVELSNIPGVANYYDRERFDRRREFAQVAHLPSAKHERPRAQQPASDLQLRYFASAPVSGKASEGPAALRDPEVRIAHQVAQAIAGEENVGARQAKLAAIARDLALAEDTAIATGIGATRIDWSGRVDLHELAALELSARIVETGEIRAGAPFTLKVAVKNAGATPVERVHAITECLRDELDGIELLLGHIEPGETVTRDVRLQVMGWHSSFTDALRVDLHAGEPDLTPDGTATVRFDVVGLTRPQLTFDYWIVDDPALVAKAPPRPAGTLFPGEAAFAVRGNGDGNLQPGEQVLIALEARNAGPGAATDTRALVHNLSGTQVLLEEGFVQLGPIPVGGLARGSFGLTVSPAADPAKPVSFDIVVADVQLRESVRHKFELPIFGQTGQFAAALAQKRIGAEPARLYNAAHGNARQIGEIPAGVRLDILGLAGGWAAISAGPGRRAWLPADLLQPVAGKGTAELPARTYALVQPPVLALEPTQQVTAEASVEVSGIARHPLRVHDVLVTVKPAGVGQVEQKITYEANPAHQGDAARQMTFATQVPLAPGSNQILVTARDAEDVEVTREIWVFRTQDGNLGPAD